MNDNSRMYIAIGFGLICATLIVTLCCERTLPV
jgi:hypothetical protein